MAFELFLLIQHLNQIEGFRDHHLVLVVMLAMSVIDMMVRAFSSFSLTIIIIIRAFSLVWHQIAGHLCLKVGMIAVEIESLCL
jgi:hypothetical protein